MSKIIKYMSNKSRNVIFSKSKNPTPKITQDLGGGDWGPKSCVIFDVDFFDFEKMTFLDLFDMY